MTLQDVKAAYNKFKLAKNIQAHCLKVATVCQIIASKFQEKGIQVDQQRLIIAALLHDIFKVCDFQDFNPQLLKEKINATDKEIKTWQQIREQFRHINHAQAAYIYFKQKDPIIAQIILKHDFPLINNPKEKPQSLEEKILYYADKRVSHDKIMSLTERLEEAVKRYSQDGKISPGARILIEKCQELESQLFNQIELKPSDITEKTASQTFQELSEEINSTSN